MSVIHAVYKNGVFQPTAPVDLPEDTRVEFEPKVLGKRPGDPSGQQAIYSLLKQSFPSGECDVAERHNEHQP